MAVLKMQRITVCALKKDRKAILEKLQSMGVLQVDPVLENDSDFKTMDTAGQRMGFEKAAAAVDQALDILDKYVPEKKSVFAALEGRKVITAKTEAQVREKRRELLRTARQISELDRERAEQNSLIAKLENNIESLEPWMNLDVPVKTQSTRRTVLMPGTMPGGTTQEEIYEILAEKAPQAEGADIHIVSSEPGMVYLTVLCMKEDARDVEDALRSAGLCKAFSYLGRCSCTGETGTSGTDSGLQEEDLSDQRTDQHSCPGERTAENCGGLLPGAGRQICSAGRTSTVAQNFCNQRIYSPV